MTKMSKAAVLHKKEHIEIQEFPIPEIGKDDAILRVEACGVCGFDNEAYLLGGNGVFQLPCVIGHEVVGIIDQIGEEAQRKWGVKKGERIVVEEYIPCGECDPCLTGHYHLCFVERYGAMHIETEKTALWGGFSEYMYLHPRSIIHKVDPKVPAKLLPLFIPISNGIHWVREVGEGNVGDTVIIQGPGPMGLGAVIGAKEAGAGNIIVIGLARDKERFKIAKELGADHILIIDEQDVVEEVKKLTNGKMGDVVINAASSPKAIVQSVLLAGHFGRVVQSGTEDAATDNFMSSQITWKLLTVRGVLGRPKRAVSVALRLIESGKYPLEKILSHEFSIDETDQAIRTAAYGLDGAVHVAVVNEF